MHTSPAGRLQAPCCAVCPSKTANDGDCQNDTDDALVHGTTLILDVAVTRQVTGAASVSGNSFASGLTLPTRHAHFCDTVPCAPGLPLGGLPSKLVGVLAVQERGSPVQVVKAPRRPPRQQALRQSIPFQRVLRDRMLKRCWRSVLAIAGSWRDTLPDACVLRMLQKYNAGRPMLHRPQ